MTRRKGKKTEPKYLLSWDMLQNEQLDNEAFVEGLRQHRGRRSR